MQGSGEERTICIDIQGVSTAVDNEAVRGKLRYDGEKSTMPIIKSAIKRMKQTLVRRERNVGIKKDIKTATKAFAAKPSATTLSKAQSELDKAVKKGLIKKNTAARRKANLAKAAKAAGAKPAAAKKTASKPTTKTAAKAAPAKKAPAAKTTAAKKPAAKKPAAKKTSK